MAKKQFKAESKRLLDLMINSIYTHKEIFLREIISNASDACDKLCYQALTDDSVKLTRKDFKIDLSVNKDARTITVTDNGIGMDKEDLENNLGVIASSGSYKFKQEVGENFSSYLTRYRLERAQELLQTTDLPVASVAVQTGYTTPGYFSRLYKKYKGVSPEAERRGSKS